MKYITRKILLAVFSVVCLLGVCSSQVEAKILASDLETKVADYYITKEAMGYK